MLSGRPEKKNVPSPAYTDAKTLVEASIFVALLVAVAYSVGASQSSINNLPADPWIVTESGLYVLDTQKTACIGPVAPCMNTTHYPGVTTILTPIKLSTAWLLDTTLFGLRLSSINASLDADSLVSGAYLSAISPIAHVKYSGGIVIGPDPGVSDNSLLTLVGTPVNYVINNMWASTSSFSIVDPNPSVPPSYIDSVCHILNATICGKLFRNTLDDPGYFYSAGRVLFGSVDYGAIIANLNSGILFNQSMVVTKYVDTGTAVPCIPNPTNSMPPSENLWMDLYANGNDGKCLTYTSIESSVISTQACFPLSSIPSNFSAYFPAALAATATFTGESVEFAFYTDLACATQPPVYHGIPLGCTSMNTFLPPGTFSPFVAIYLRIQLSLN